jgi:ribosomal protein L16 Arg81 hydroxylase
MSKSIVRTSLRVFAGSFLLAACFSLFAPAARAETPTFKAPEVNEYVKKQTAFMDDFIAALKEGDEDKKTAASKAMSEHADKNMFAVYEKLTDAEKPVYDKWVKDESGRMAEAIKKANEE